MSIPVHLVLTLLVWVASLAWCTTEQGWNQQTLSENGSSVVPSAIGPPPAPPPPPLSFLSSVDSSTTIENDVLVSSLNITAQEAVVVAAAASSSPSSPSEPLESSSMAFNCLSQLECDAALLQEMGPPSDLLVFLPPPPLPAFLLNTIDIAVLSESSRLTGESDLDSGHCIFCDWANRENDTLLGTRISAATSTSTTTEPTSGSGVGREGRSGVGTSGSGSPPPPPGGGGISDETAWISIVVFASLASAAIGALLMIFFLKCRKFRILPVTDSCPILSDSYFGSKSNARESAECRNCASEESTVGHGDNIRCSPPPKPEVAVTQPKPRPTSGGGGWSFWRRNSASTERPLRSPGSMGSEENSYSEEPYVVSEHSSALYAELNSVCQDGTAPYRTYTMNTYSEVTDPNAKKCSHHHLHLHHHHHPNTNSQQHHFHGGRRLIGDGTYENAAYVVSESIGGEVFQGPTDLALTPSQLETDSLDTPSSSAYYSDCSNQTNGRKRKKKQHRPLVDGGGGGGAPPESVALDNLPVAAPETVSAHVPVVYFPADYGGRLVRYGHDRCSGTQTTAGQQQQSITLQPLSESVCCSGKRPLPPPPASPLSHSSPCPSSTTVRPLPPVPSQYV